VVPRIAVLDVSRQSVDAVLIAMAPLTHATYIEIAIAAGKAALCEKPIDRNLARGDARAAKIRDTTVPAKIGFNRRYDPGHSAARAPVLAGEIGDLHQVSIASGDPSPPPRAYREAAGGRFRE
jgi:myo-inositol 2-dehydrogenase / D-chiro-inositol 1-dehydrogenase